MPLKGASDAVTGLSFVKMRNAKIREAYPIHRVLRMREPER
jgi:hypothetical protein